MENSEKIKNGVRLRIARYLEYKGHTQSDIRALCGLDKSFYYQLGDPNMASINKIIKRFPRLSLDYLMRGIMPMEVALHRPEEPVSNDTMAGDTTFNIDVQDDETPDRVAEPTKPYEGKRDENEMITIPASILADLRDQLKKKDQQLENCAAQIATLLTILNK